MSARPTPITRPGLDIIADELGRFVELNGQLEQENYNLRLRVLDLERQIAELNLQSQFYSTSGTNNVVLP